LYYPAIYLQVQLCRGTSPLAGSMLTCRLIRCSVHVALSQLRVPLRLLELPA
jgi:hypothetical protein